MNHETQLKPDTLSTQQMEKHIHQVYEDIRRYRDVEASAALAEFMALRPIVEAKEFQDYKNELLTTRYKDREEYKTLKRYESVKRSHHVRWYNFFVGLSSVQEFTHFAETADFAKLSDPESVKADPRLKRMAKLSRSFAVRRFQVHKDSGELSEYFTLRDKVNTTEFREANNFWKNPNRWYTTLQSQQDGKYEALKNSSDIAFFLAQDPKKIAEYERYQEIFADACEWNKMQDSPWQAGFHFEQKQLKTNYSFADAAAAMNAGRNVSTMGGKMMVSVRTEHVSAPAWHPTKGFVMKEFDYTGDVIQTADTFQADKGLFQVKAAFNGKAHAAIYLTCDKPLPRVCLAEWDGEKVYVGAKFAQFEERTQVDGLKAGQDYIFSVKITDSDITWSVNNQEVAHTANKLTGKLYPMVTAFLPEGEAAPGSVSVDWIKAYSF